MKLSNNVFHSSLQDSTKINALGKGQLHVCVNQLSNIMNQKILKNKQVSFNRLKQKIVLKLNKQKQFLQDFSNHCATIIQSNYRSYIQKKKYKQFLPIYRRLKQILLSSVKGWKTRKILQLSMMVKLKNQIRCNQKNKRQKQVRIKKRQFVDDFHRLFKNGDWIELLRKQIKYQSKALNIILDKNNLERREKICSLYGSIKPVKNLKQYFQSQNIKIKVRNIIQSNQKRQNIKNIVKKDELIKAKVSKVKKQNKILQIQQQIEPTVQVFQFNTPKYCQNGFKSTKKTLNVVTSNKGKAIVNCNEKQNKQYNIRQQQETISQSQIQLKQDAFFKNNDKKKLKKGIIMTLSKQFQFQSSVKKTSLINQSKLQTKFDQLQVSSFDQISSQTAKYQYFTKNSIISGGIKAMKYQLDRKKELNQKRHKQVIDKLQNCKLQNHLD